MSTKSVALIFLFFLPLANVAHAKPNPLTKDRVELQTEYGPVLLQNVEVEQGMNIRVSGTVTNQSSRAWRYIAFTLTFRDKKGKELTADIPLSSEVDVRDLGKGETKPLTGITGSSPADLMLMLHGKIADFDIQWSKEHSYYASHTVFSLTEPSASKSLSYEDASIAISFAVANEELDFTLRNKTQEPQSINWDEVSFIDLSGTAHRVLHQGVKLVDRDKPQSPSVIPPGAKINDLVEPSDAVRFSSTINEWEHDPLLPPSQTIVNFKGKTFGVFMPIVIDGKKKNYTFTIRIDDVEM